eukprot:CAMPEP_0178967242 /NCGR_PEP_ID=MMETSP0789-20121207/17455_1 /TAXON_ID=3005 /ORGANISM="Rhizosolenia setigera, Strain CCMP 1694" /LENGTH=452 /DNA_ID=CAMNT_0020652769 /DNA_START=93 /DNA_END=1448 /DNA_ORIENTATION=+
MVQSLEDVLPSSAKNVDETSEKSGATTPDEKNLMNDLDRTTNLYDFYFASDEACDMLPNRRILNLSPIPMASGNTMKQDNFFISDRGTHDDATRTHTHFVPPCTSQEHTIQEHSKISCYHPMKLMDLCIPSIQSDFSPVDQTPFVNSSQKNDGKIDGTPSFPLEENPINSSSFEMPEINTHKSEEEYNLHPTGFMSIFSLSSKARKARENSELPPLTVNGNEVFFSDEEEEKKDEEEQEESEDGSNYSSSSTYSSHDTVSKAHSGKKKKKDSNPKRPISGSAVACDREVELEFRKDGSNNRSSSTRSSSTTNKRKNASVKKSRTQTSSNNNNNGKKLGRPKRTSKVGYPKRPLSAYNFYFKDERKRLLQTMPKNKDLMSLSTSQSYKRKGRGPPHHKISFQEMGKKIGNNWKNVGKSMKDKYNLMAKEEKKKYEEKLKEFKKLNPNQMKGSS